MTDKEGILRMLPSGRWAVVRPGHQPVEITSGEVFRVEVDGKLRATRMEFMHHAEGDGSVAGRCRPLARAEAPHHAHAQLAQPGRQVDKQDARARHADD
jgi:hypothetical protein